MQLCDGIFHCAVQESHCFWLSLRVRHFQEALTTAFQPPPRTFEQLSSPSWGDGPWLVPIIFHRLRLKMKYPNTGRGLSLKDG